MNGCYEDGYKACSCFWGKEPSSFVRKLVNHLGSIDGLRIFDVGCGEGKNSVYLARLGANVLALDISASALENAFCSWPILPSIEWRRNDIRDFYLNSNSFDIVILYGLLHCMRDEEEISYIIKKLDSVTVSGGFHVICNFNARKQDLSAHPDFEPTLLSHNRYLEFYKDWNILEESDSDLWEIHPHNNIRHMHSMTRLIAKKE